MSMVQLHGKNFEDIIKATLFSGAADGGRASTAVFDVEDKFDKSFGLPSSIKTAKLDKNNNASIGLSDARRFWTFSQSYMLYVGLWEQCSNIKKFVQVKRFFIDQVIHGKLIGDLTLSDITDFHESFNLTNFPLGKHCEARKLCKSEKKDLQTKCKNIILNPKVDSKSQRRLQCSVRLKSLEDLAKSLGTVTLSNGVIVPYFYEYIGNIGTHPLPMEIISCPRKFVDHLIPA